MHNHKVLWLWIPAFAGTTSGGNYSAAVTGALAPLPYRWSM